MRIKKKILHIVYLTTFEWYKHVILNGGDGDLHPVHSFIAGMLGGLNSLLISYPQEIIKAKL